MASTAKAKSEASRKKNRKNREVLLKSWVFVKLVGGGMKIQRSIFFYGDGCQVFLMFFGFIVWAGGPSPFVASPNISSDVSAADGKNWKN